jgi:imidazolonepropionase-like amidohydrolase
VKLPEDQEPRKDEKHRRKADSQQERPKVEPDERVSAAERTLRELRRGRIPALLRAERADDLLCGMDLARTYGLKPILLGGAEAGLVAREIAEAGVPLFLGPLTAQPDGFEQLAARYDNAAVLHRAGVRLAFRTGAAHSARLLPQQAAVAVAHGLPWEAAVHGLSAAAWEILGIPGMGRLEVGAEATFFLADGDPLQPRHAVRRAWIAGQEVSLQTRQTRLYEAFRTLR